MPDPDALLWNLVRGAMATQALRVVAELGIADELAEGPRPAGELARRAGVDADALSRFLRALASEGVFAEAGPGVFRNTEASERLARGGAWHAMAHFFGGVWYDVFAEAPRAVREGRETFSGSAGDAWWPWLTARPEEAALFNRGMQGGAEGRVDRFAELPWADETVVDVGGGNGTMLIGLLQRAESLRGIVFDLPEIAGEARERIAEAGLAERCDVVEGDARDSVPSGADVYLLCSVLHDWDDDGAEAILRAVRAAAPDGARLLVADAVIPPGNEPYGSKWLDLLMLALTNGRERTEPEWRALLERTGFTVTQIEDGLIQCR